mmetsp:Transcript_10011/g.31539  ORF Transcript_10011/g.31539 Transcript_10011/m.31539 type:complete len:297 (-) Transcript_10011:796-1686(-)
MSHRERAGTSHARRQRGQSRRARETVSWSTSCGTENPSGGGTEDLSGPPARAAGAERDATLPGGAARHGAEEGAKRVDAHRCQKERIDEMAPKQRSQSDPPPSAALLAAASRAGSSASSRPVTTAACALTTSASAVRKLALASAPVGIVAAVLTAITRVGGSARSPVSRAALRTAASAGSAIRGGRASLKERGADLHERRLDHRVAQVPRRLVRPAACGLEVRSPSRHLPEGVRQPPHERAPEDPQRRARRRDVSPAGGRQDQPRTIQEEEEDGAVDVEGSQDVAHRRHEVAELLR